jgi:hypothetical protein
MGKRTAVIVSLAVTLGLSVVGIGTGVSAAQPRDRTGLGVIQLGSSYVGGSRYNRYGYAIVGPAAARLLHKFRGIGLVYESSMETLTDCAGDACPVGVTYDEARRNGWVLTTTSGAELVPRAYPSYRLVDVGNRAFQDRWAGNVARYLHRTGAKGVFIDQVLASVTSWSGGEAPAKYPTDAAWEEAMASFVRTVGSTLKAKGFYVLASAHKYIANDHRSDSGELEAAWWTRLAPYVNGLLCEYWQQNPTDPSQPYFDGPGVSWTGNWNGWQRLASLTQRLGRDFFGLQYVAGDSQKTLEYGRSSFLLQWNGAGGAYLGAVNGSGDLLDTSAAWAANIGKPVGAAQRAGVGWRRTYSRGLVLVNPNPTSALTVSFKKRYAMPDGSIVQSVTLAPVSGLILRSR